MKNHGTYEIYLTGSKTTVKRVVYENEDGKCFVKWYGKYIEVKHNVMNYSTVEAY